MELWTIERYERYANDGYNRWETVLDSGLFKSKELAQAHVDKLNATYNAQVKTYDQALVQSKADYEAEKAKLKEAGFASSLARCREVYAWHYITADLYRVGEPVEVNE